MEDKVVAEVPEDAPENEEFLRMAHHALLEVRQLATFCLHLELESQGFNPPTDGSREPASDPTLAVTSVSQVRVLTGELECPESGKVFPIKRGIPNMLLDEDEV